MCNKLYAQINHAADTLPFRCDFFNSNWTFTVIIPIRSNNAYPKKVIIKQHIFNASLQVAVEQILQGPQVFRRLFQQCRYNRRVVILIHDQVEQKCAEDDQLYWCGVPVDMGTCGNIQAFFRLTVGTPTYHCFHQRPKVPTVEPLHLNATFASSG